jgi:hypothetical protein
MGQVTYNLNTRLNFSIQYHFMNYVVLKIAISDIVSDEFWADVLFLMFDRHIPA